MINEFGEEIKEDEIKKLIERIEKLSDKKLDELWYGCKLIERGFTSNKALSSDLIEEFRQDKENSEAFLTLINETHFKDILKNLKDIEKSD